MIDYLLNHTLEVVAIVVAFIIFYLQQRKKSLTYTILTNSNVISVSDKVKDKIRILYLEEVISNLQLVEIRIKNTGNLPIKPDDYIEPLAIRHADTARILSVEVIDNQSLGIYIETEISDQSTTILSKTLLNPNDAFDIKILLKDENADFSITGRIVGLPKIHSSPNRSPLIKLSTLVRPAFIFIIFSVGLSLSDELTIVESIGLVGFAFLIIGLLSILVALMARLEARLDKAQYK
jgi:hypothetical protein